MQTVWLRLAEYSGRIREPDRLAAWLATATRNEALRVIKGQQRVVPHAGFAESSEPTSRSIEDVITDDVTLRAVLQAFAALPAADQQLLRLLCTVPPLDYQTIAEILGRSIGSIGPSQGEVSRQAPPAAPGGHRPESRWMMSNDRSSPNRSS